MNRIILVGYLFFSLVVFFMILCTNAPAKNNGEWDNASPEIKSWFHRDRIQNCCSDADGKITQWEIKPDGYYVPVPWKPQREEYWERVPNDKIIITEGNPVGQALIWFDMGTYSIRCFIPGGGV